MSLRVCKTRQSKLEDALQRESESFSKRRAISQLFTNIGSKSNRTSSTESSNPVDGLLRKLSISSASSKQSWSSHCDASSSSQSERALTQFRSTLSDSIAALQRVSSFRSSSRTSVSSVQSIQPSPQRTIRPTASWRDQTDEQLTDAPTLTAVRLRIYPETEWMAADEGCTFWIAVETEACLSNGFPSATDIPSPQQHGEIRNISLNFTPLPGCVIEKILGDDRELSSLELGGTVCVLVRVKADRAGSSSVIGNAIGFGQGRLHLEDAFTSLESHLGITIIPVVTVECRYEQSLFPSDNQITVKDTVYVCRESRIAPKHSGFEFHFSQLAAKNRREVHARLAHHIAHSRSPQQALVELDQTFSLTRRGCACPDYLEVLKRELWQQLRPEQDDQGSQQQSFRRIRERLSHHTPKPVNSASASAPAPAPAPVAGAATKTPPPPSFPSPLRPSLPAITATSRTTCKPAASQGVALVAVAGLAPPAPSSLSTLPPSPDPARRIWRHIRASSRGAKTPLHLRTVAGANEYADCARCEGECNGCDDDGFDGVLVERMGEMRRRAAMNRRSLGAETLRSLALGMAVVEDGKDDDDDDDDDNDGDADEVD